MKRLSSLACLSLAVFAVAETASAADLVCFGTIGRGVTCINGGKFEHHTRESARLPSNSVSVLMACGDKIVAAIGGAVVTYDGKAWSAPNRPPRGFASRLACAGPGKYWATTSGGAAYWDGGAWKSYTISEVLPGAGTSVVFDVAAGPGGSAWFALATGIVAQFDAGQWAMFKEGQGFDKKYPFTRIHSDSKGQPWIPAGGAVLTLREGKFQPVAGISSFSAIAFGADGKRWLGYGNKLSMADGNRSAEFDLGWSIRGLAVDGDGRVWIAGEFGVARFADGKFEARHMHDSPLPDNDYASVAAIGKGVELPAKADQPAGSLTGRLEWKDGKPVAGAELQICGVGLSLISGAEGPCGNRPLFFAATTDGDGKFQFPKTPPAAYRIAVKPIGATRWIVFLGSSDRLRVGPGEAKMSGTLVMDTRHRPK